MFHKNGSYTSLYDYKRQDRSTVKWVHYQMTVKEWYPTKVWLVWKIASTLCAEVVIPTCGIKTK